jgi:dTMP kinase
LGEKLRELLLVEPMRPETEALLMFAVRQEHVATVIGPALAQGVWVVCDRFSDASFAYQGGGRGLLPERLGVLEQWVHGDLQPDLTLLFDVATAQARARVASHTVVPDRFEQERAPFFEAVRAAYLERARSAPQRIRIVDAAQPLSEVARQVQAAVWQLLQADAAASN